jgi:hypothetical protein
MTSLETLKVVERRVSGLQTQLAYVERGLRNAETLAKVADCAKKNARTIIVTAAVATIGLAVVSVVVRRRRRRKNS